jgi:hypothetical protein
MSARQRIPDLPAPLVAQALDHELEVGLPEGPRTTFVLMAVPSLTKHAAADIVERASGESARQILVSYRDSSAEARAALRDAGISFAGEDGRLFLRAPGLFIERDEPPRTRSPRRWEIDLGDFGSVRNPFAKRSSRIPRWLLLHHHESFSIGQLAHAAELNPAATSRIVRALEEGAFVSEGPPDIDARRRQVRLQRPRALLDAWLPDWQRRRVRQQRWDIGARDAYEALDLLRDFSRGQTGGWAIGGVAGAALVRKAVEPAEVLVWLTAEEREALASTLQPETGRPGRGTLRIAIAPDPWTVRLARPITGVPVADAVQLWLDCASEGERALEAADAVARTAGWS